MTTHSDVTPHYIPIPCWDYQQFELIVVEMELDRIKPYLEETRRTLKDAANYYWDNEQYKFSNIYGDMFSFMINTVLAPVTGKHIALEVHVWNSSGGTVVFRGSCKTDADSRKQLYKSIVQKSERFTAGYVDCAQCGKESFRYGTATAENNNIAGRFYAGLYCYDCWHNKGVKEEERRENYD